LQEWNSHWEDGEDLLPLIDVDLLENIIEDLNQEKESEISEERQKPTSSNNETQSVGNGYDDNFFSDLLWSTSTVQPYTKKSILSSASEDSEKPIINDDGLEKNSYNQLPSMEFSSHTDTDDSKQDKKSKGSRNFQSKVKKKITLSNVSNFISSFQKIHGRVSRRKSLSSTNQNVRRRSMPKDFSAIPSNQSKMENLTFTSTSVESSDRDSSRRASIGNNNKFSNRTVRRGSSSTNYSSKLTRRGSSNANFGYSYSKRRSSLPSLTTNQPEIVKPADQSKNKSKKKTIVVLSHVPSGIPKY